MDILKKIVTFQAHEEAGIAPTSLETLDFNRVLDALPSEEARKMRRKFRKLWRKLASKGRTAQKKAVGLGASNPTRQNKRARQALVRSKIMENVGKTLRSMAQGQEKDSSEK